MARRERHVRRRRTAGGHRPGVGPGPPHTPIDQPARRPRGAERVPGLDYDGKSRSSLTGFPFATLWGTPFHFSHLKGTAPGDRVLTQQRRLRLGDILDDYCPRERRITNHAVVAMIEDAVKQTRCTTCDADHEYKGGKLPAHRRRKPEGALVSEAEAQSRPELVSADVATVDETLPAD